MSTSTTSEDITETSTTTTTCPICLDELCQNMGALIPCGHCLHRECFDFLYADAITHGTTVTCPICKLFIHRLQPLYLEARSNHEEEEDSTHHLRYLERQQQQEQREEILSLRRQLFLKSTLLTDQTAITEQVQCKVKDEQCKAARIKRDLDQAHRQHRQVLEEQSQLQMQLWEARKAAKKFKAKLDYASSRMGMLQKEKIGLQVIVRRQSQELFHWRQRQQDLKSTSASADGEVHKNRVEHGNESDTEPLTDSSKGVSAASQPSLSAPVVVRRTIFEELKQEHAHRQMRMKQK